MKTIAVCLSLISSIALAQERNESKTIPANVVDAFTILYPQAKDIDWSFEAKDFEVSFIENERARSIVFDIRGNLMMVKDKIDRAELPPPVITTVEEQYPDWSVQKTFRIDITGTPSYQIELHKAGERLSLICGKHGDIIRIVSGESFK